MERKQLRILHVQPMSLGLFGHRDEELGSSLHYSVSRLAAAQAAKGDRVEVHLIASGAPMAFRAQDVEFTFHRGAGPPRIGDRLGPFGRQASVGQVRAIQARAADVVHFHGIRQFHLMYYAVAMQAARRQIPWSPKTEVAEEHAGWSVGLNDVPSRGQQPSWRRVGHAQPRWNGAASLPDATFVVPNGVDRTLFLPRRAPPSGTRFAVSHPVRRPSRRTQGSAHDG